MLLHPEARLILTRLADEGIAALYHFTSIENLPSIAAARALQSKAAQERAGRWPCPVPGGNDLSHDLDRQNDNWDRISMNFTPRTPMVYHKKATSHLCFFVLSPEVAGWDGIVFTDTNATAGAQARGTGLAGLELVDFEAIRARPRPWDRAGWVRPVQAETLVPGEIPLEFVQEVCFVSQASLEEGERQWGAGFRPPFRVDASMFANSVAPLALGFSFLVALTLTDEATARDRQEQPIARFTFGPHIGDRLTGVALVQPTAGATARVTWSPPDALASITFERPVRYWHWPSIRSSRLERGIHTITYEIEGVRWATIPFEVNR